MKRLASAGKLGTAWGDASIRISTKRAIFLQGEINDDLSRSLTPQILRLREESSRPITVFIDSQGGSPEHANRILGLLRAVGQRSTCPEIITVATGDACSAAADFLAQGDYVMAYPHAKLLFHGTRRAHPEITRQLAQVLEVGLTEADAVPDPNTIREFRETLTPAALFSELFAAFNTRLTDPGFITRKGQIIDASFVEVPRQRNRRQENAAIKHGEVPAGWKQDAKRSAHKDLDARWTKKNEQNYYGYKDQVVADLESKLIVRAAVATASEHDSQARDALTRPGDPATWADSAYTGANCQALFEAKGIAAHVCAKGTRGHELTKSPQRSNRAKSRQRVRGEHIFGFMTGSMRGMFQRCIGWVRNRACILLTHLVSNMARTEQIIRLQLLGRKTPKLV